MLSIKSFTFNPFQENTYLLSDAQQRCWIIDPGMVDQAERDELLAYISKHALQPQAIINTHTHIDHIFGVDFLAQYFGIPFFCNELDLPVLKNGANVGQMLGIPFSGVQTPAQLLPAGQPLMLGDASIDVRFVPGHSPGSIAFYYAAGNWVISGDTLFAGGIGRTDLMGGDYETLIRSIKTELLSLPPDTAVYSGHGRATTVATEIASNYFLQ
jgi:glyoxylase-like metal-dependent hydrolase (beta-lactamase superfamily II)